MTRKIKKEWESNRLNVAAFLCAIGLMFMPGCQGGQQLRSVQDRHLTLDQGLEALSMNLVSSLPQDRKLLVAVLDFNDLAGCVSAFGRLVGEELITQLFQTKRVQVVERSQLDKALNEQSFIIVMLTRLSLVIPYSVLNYLYSVTGVKKVPYMLASAIGLIPLMGLWAYVGTLAKNFDDILSGDMDSGLSGQVLFFVGLGAILLAVWVMHRTASRVLKERLAAADAEPEA